MKDQTARPIFSIIIPVYNGAQYLRKCADSVLEYFVIVEPGLKSCNG